MHLHGKPWRVTTRGTHTVPSSGNEARVSFTVNGFRNAGRQVASSGYNRKAVRARYLGNRAWNDREKQEKWLAKPGSVKGTRATGFYTVQSIIMNRITTPSDRKAPARRIE